MFLHHVVSIIFYALCLNSLEIILFLCLFWMFLVYIRIFQKSSGLYKCYFSIRAWLLNFFGKLNFYVYYKMKALTSILFILISFSNIWRRHAYLQFYLLLKIYIQEICRMTLKVPFMISLYIIGQHSVTNFYISASYI